MRTVRGRSDRVVVVGAGLSGLAAALHLAGAGREVSVVEREPRPGGRCGLLERDGFRFDTGPTVLTMPELLERAFAAVGERLADWVELVGVQPLYRARFADGSGLDVHADPDAMAAEIERLCGPRDVAGYLAFRRFVTRLYQVEMPHFIDRNVDGPLALAGTPMLRLLALGGFRRLAGKVAGYLRDPRLQRVFSFQAMYAGLAPHRALALYAVIAYMDSVAGVYFPRGGMHVVPTAMAAVAQLHGVAFHYRCEATRVHVRAGRAVGVSTGDGQYFPADAVVLTPDLPVAYRTLLPAGAAPRRLRRLRYSPSCFLLLVGSRAAYPRDAHHTITFGDAWEQTFRELIAAGALMSDPSFLVTCPTRSDPALAPAGRHSYYVLFPTPNADAGLDWAVLGPRYRDEVVETLQERGYPGFGAGIEVEHTLTPHDWQRMGLDRGTPFAAAHTFGQTGPFRPANLAPGLDNVVFAGSGTVPGVGIPMVLVSGRLAAQRITGGLSEG
ncbi:MAG: phytoene desaturase family protein [Frankiaceae bacterium]